MGYLKYSVLKDALIKQLRSTETESYEEAYYIIDCIIHLHDVARKEGLHAIEDEVSHIANDCPIYDKNDHNEWPDNISGWKRFLVRGKMLIIDCPVTEDVENILCTNYFANKYSDREALFCAMTIWGLLMIRERETPSVVFEKMISFLPEEAENEYLRRHSDKVNMSVK